MSSRTRLTLPLFVVALFSLAFLAGCSSSGAKPNPVGFSNSNLNGTYVFSTSGTDAGGAPIMITGAFTASGSGSISGGAFTLVDGGGITGTGTAAVLSNQTITGGSYSITSDGRGQVQLGNSAGIGTITLDIALSSSSHGVVSEFDPNGTGSGTLDLQGTFAQSGFNGQSYAFSVAGSNATSFSLIAEAGAFTLDANGAVTTGIEDITIDNTSTGVSSSEPGLGIATSSSLAIGTGTSPGVFSIATSAGTFTFDAYAIDATHVKLIENDSAELVAGDMLTQGTSLPSGTLAFTMQGMDSSLYPLAIGGLLPVSGGAISGGLEDYNDAGTVNTASNVSGSFTALAGGRSVLSMGPIENGGSVDGTYSFAAYPTISGLILLEIDNNGITMGTAMAQTNTSFAASQNYAFDLSAVNISGGTTGSGGSGFYEEDDIGQFTSTSSTFSGVVDVNDEGTLSSDQRITGQYQSASTGRYTFTANFNGANGGASGVFYTVDGSTLLMLEGDQYQIGAGTIGVQSVSAAQGSLVHAIAAARPRIAANRAAKRTR